MAGLNQFNRTEIFNALQDPKTNQVPFVNLPERKSQHQHAVTEEVMREVHWLRAEQAAEIEFVERTPHGKAAPCFVQAVVNAFWRKIADSAQCGNTASCLLFVLFHLLPSLTEYCINSNFRLRDSVAIRF